jgi:glycosyltransferase involved in cell wall biosynthesis
MTTDVALMVYSMRSGGVERMRIRLGEALQKRGYATTIVVARVDGHWGRHRSEIPRGVRLVDLRAHSWNAWLGSLTAYLKAERPRVLLAAMETAGVIALWARRRAQVKTRVVVSSHIQVSRHIESDWKRVKRILVPYLVRRFYCEADGVVAVSDGVADNLAPFARLPRGRIRVIHNPVVTDQLTQASEQKAPHPWLAEPYAPLIIGAGRLTRQKEFDTLVRAFSLVRRHRLARLMILGEGEERDSLEELVRRLGLEEYVQMPGFVPNLTGYTAHASLLVLSSAWEGFGNVLVEALACGCPVVSTDCPSGPREILDNGKYGRLVSVGDHEALARAILETLDHPPDAKMLRVRAMDFHVDKIIDQYLEVMDLA